MRSVDEIEERWRAMQPYRASPADLRRAVKTNGPSNPCIAGLRSVCWKNFLLFKNEADDWEKVLRHGRDDYAKRRDNFLKYIKHPEALANLAVDPLADEPNSPWDTVRQDEVIRAEIQQDVQRLPDEVNYHDDRIQTLILDVLFVYCKSFPERGGYRQGMHEILAPIVHVLETDSIDAAATGDTGSIDAALVDLVDASCIEHDAYMLFACLMENAQSFYAVGDGANTGAMTSREQQTSSIVERSKFIHEVCLQKVDPELASHLINIEILPQIFLIRWVRLLFSREFPFEQVLVLWDTMFAVDPSLELIDLVCVAMLIRIRWQLLEADYSVCLQLLLKYPPPKGPLGPQEFVDDAEYLRKHLNTTGGGTLIMKHTGKLPDIPKTPGPEASRPLTPNLNSFHTLRQRALGSRSPLGAPASFINQQGGVEALFQGAAKGAAKRAKDVMERGEKLGINQAVRDAMGEIRRNMQNLNDTRHTARPGFNNTGDGSAAEAATTAAATALVAMEKRSQQLAGMLEESVASLRAISAAGLEDKAKSLETIEVAAAKVDFVKVHLEDPTLEVPTEVGEAEAGEAEAEVKADEVPAGKGTADGQASPPVLDAPVGETALPSQAKSPEIKSPGVKSPEIKASVARTIPVKKGSSSSQATPPLSAAVTSSEAADAPKQRPSAVPARSSIAQSSFSWMLEPDESTSGGGGGSASGTGNKTASAAASARSPTAATHRKRPSNGVSRERNAFLFGDEGTEAAGPLGKRDDLFSMEQLKR